MAKPILVSIYPNRTMNKPLHIFFSDSLIQILIFHSIVGKIWLGQNLIKYKIK